MGAMWELGRLVWVIVKVSRPGFYNVTGFLYAIPAAANPSKLLAIRPILGLLFCCVPMNLVVYGMNDLGDVDVDAKNPRKGGLFGAKASEADLWLCCIIGAIAVTVLPPLLTGDIVWSLCWTVAGILPNWLYNFGPKLSRVPFLDMLPPIGYLLTIPFAGKVMGDDLAWLSYWFYGFIIFVVFRTQTWFQRFDLEEDLAAGKRTTAGAIGQRASGAGIVVFIAGELLCGYFWNCQGALMWSAFSLCVFLLECMLQSVHVTKALMGVGGAAAFLPMSKCFIDACSAVQ